MKKHRPKKLLALLLSLVMVLSMSITAFAEDSDAELENYIASLSRSVTQSGSSLSYRNMDYTTTDGTEYTDVDVYPVENRSNIYVTYNATMDMEDLTLTDTYLYAIEKYAAEQGESSSDWTAWDALLYCREYITDNTYINLVFEMDEDVLLSSINNDGLATLASQIDLVSDMFTFSGDSSDLTIDEGNDTLTIKCTWDSEKAAAAVEKNNTLDPIIYLYNVELPITATWSGSGDNDGDEDDDAELVVINNGEVKGVMYGSVDLSNTKLDVEWKINGGIESDKFILTTNNVKVSAPGNEKYILADTDGDGVDEEISSDSVNAGDTVTFELKSSVPDYLLDVIDWESDGDEDVEITPSTGLDGDAVATSATPAEESSYTITFHDVLDNSFEVNKDSFTIIITYTDSDGAEHTITLTGNDPNLSEYYTIMFSSTDDDGVTTPSDGCTFEITIDLLALYEDGYLTEDYIANAADIIVTYTATLSVDATAGCYTNESWVSYENTETEKSKVEVYTYGILVYKYAEVGDNGSDDDDVTITPLSGAQFILYKYVETTVEENSNLTYYVLTTKYAEVNTSDETADDYVSSPEEDVTYYTALSDESENTTYSVADVSSGFTSGTTYYTAYEEYKETSDTSDSSKTYYMIKYYKYTAESTDDEGNTTPASVAWVDSEDDATILTSGTDGYLTFEGLEAGTYYLLEVEAPYGYVGNTTTAIEVTVPVDGASTGEYYAKVEVENSAIPETGGMGTNLIYLAGLALVLLAGGAILVSMKRRNAEVG